MYDDLWKFEINAQRYLKRKRLKKMEGGTSSCEYLTFTDAYMCMKCHVCKKNKCICDINAEDKKKTCYEKAVYIVKYPFKNWLDSIYSKACYNLDVDNLNDISYPIVIGSIIDAIVNGKRTGMRSRR